MSAAIKLEVKYFADSKKPEEVVYRIRKNMDKGYVQIRRKKYRAKNRHFGVKQNEQTKQGKPFSLFFFSTKYPYFIYFKSLKVFCSYLPPLF